MAEDIDEQLKDLSDRLKLLQEQFKVFADNDMKYREGAPITKYMTEFDFLQYINELDDVLQGGYDPFYIYPLAIRSTTRYCANMEDDFDD